MKVSRGTIMRKEWSIRSIAVLMVAFLCLGCGISNPKYMIDDYVLVPNAKKILGNNGLTAFVFENNKAIIPFQQFLVVKYNLQTLNQREISFTINGEQFTMHVYGADDTVKYINTFDFVMKNQIPDSSKMGLQADFIVLSVTNKTNEDCLSEDSLYQNIVIKYLKNLKQAYFSNDR